MPLRVQAVYDLKNVTLIPAQAVGGVPSAGTNFSAEYDNSQTPMVAGRKTVVRLLAQAAGAPRGGATHVFAQLSGTRAGVPLPGSPLSPDRNDISVPDAPVSAQYADPANGFTFTLPPGWDAGSVNLRGQVFDRAPGSVILDDTRPAVQCASCTSNDAFTLTGVDFQLSNRLDISPVKVVWTRGGVTDVPGDVAKLTDAARATTPVADANWGVRSYQGIVDASDIAALPYLAGKDAKGKTFDINGDRGDVKNGKVWNLVESWWWNQYQAAGFKDPSGFLVMGLNHVLARGLSDSQDIFSKTGRFILSKPITAVEIDRPLSSVAHELGHALFRKHAHTDPKCGGQPGDGTWPTAQGFMDGTFGIDVRSPVASGPTPYKLFDPAKTYDLMSYCAGADDSKSIDWISSRGWREARMGAIIRSGYRANASGRSGDLAKPGPEATAAATSRGVSLLVSGFQINGRKVVLDDPQPTTGGPGAPAHSPFVAQAVDPSGRVLASSRLEAAPGHGDPAPGHPAATMTMLFGSVPTHGKRVGSLVLLLKGRIVGRRRAPRHAPRVKVQTPRPPLRGRVPATVTIRWGTTDRDHSRLRARVDYSPDNGRHWRLIWMGPSRNRAVLDSGLLSAARRARVRVRIDDGFHEARSVSRAFRLRGAPPRVNVVSPRPRTAVDSAAHLYLDAQAWDDAGRRLDGVAITWYAAGHLVARGAVTSVSGLPSGRQRLLMVARDRMGRRSAQSVSLWIRGRRRNP